jgi:hypothetical protein
MAVLGHHYQDSTHISSNVATVGITHRWLTLEASGFHGREPNESRWNLDGGAMDSYSARLTVNPTSRWSIQGSAGKLNSRESLHPKVNTLRLTSSVMYVRPTTKGWFATTLLWGNNRDVGPPHREIHRDISKPFEIRSVTIKPGPPQPSALPDVMIPFHSGLAEATWRTGKNWMWGRFEIADKPKVLIPGMTPEALEAAEEPLGRVSAYTIGYERELPRVSPWLSTGLGAQMNFYQIPVVLKPIYGSHPVGAQLFLRFRLTKQ